MQAVKGKRTRLEKRLFGLLARMRVKGWKQNVKSIRGKPDVVFANQKVVIFIDGCFWHSCPFCRRTLPKTNRAYWAGKLKRNIALAKSHNNYLRRNGWTVLRIWEHEMIEPSKVKQRILVVLEKKGAPSATRD